MQQSLGQRPTTAAAVIGALLIAVGVITLALREVVGINFFETLGRGAWPFLVIVPGVVLLGASLLPAPPRGLGFAIAGAIVTTVGALLLYQSQSGHWESWAYAWALIPASAGVALVLYGLLTRTGRFVGTGLWLTLIAGALFVAGAWFFEGLFAGEPRPADLGNWWPVGLVAIGVIVMTGAFLPKGRPSDPPTPGASDSTRPS